MKTRVLSRKDKAFNTIYRIILFLCFIAAVMSVYGILAIALNEHDDFLVDKTISRMSAMTYGYYVLLIGSAAAVVMSILARKIGSAVSLFFRTASSLTIFILCLCGSGFMSIVRLLCSIVNKFGIEYIKSEPSPYELGITQEQLNKIESIDSYDESVFFPLIIGIFAGAFVYFILSLTSLHSLFKQRKIPVSNGVPMDDELARYYDNSSSGYDNINNL